MTFQATVNSPYAGGSTVSNTGTVSGSNFVTANSNPVVTNVVTPPALVGNPVINGDNPNGLFTAAGQPANGVQRSMVEDVVYTFNEPVTITNPNAAFTVAGADRTPGPCRPACRLTR